MKLETRGILKWESLFIKFKSGVATPSWSIVSPCWLKWKMFLIFAMIPTTLLLYQHCHTVHTANLIKALVDIVRLHGLKIGDGCIIRLVLMLYFVTLVVKHLKLGKWISQRVTGKLRLLLKAFPTGKMWRESLRSTVHEHADEKLYIYQEPQEILLKVWIQHTRRRNGWIASIFLKCYKISLHNKE